MQKKYNYILLLFLMLHPAVKLCAQDYHLSIYDAAPLGLNPGLTGIFDGQYRVHAQQRMQWKTVNFKPYLTSVLSLDAPRGRWGFGGQIINMRAGFGNFNSLEFCGSTAYYIPLDKAKNNIVSMGIQVGVKQKTVEYNLLTFDNQYTTSNGGGFDRGISSGESFVNQTIYLPQVNAGALFYNANQRVRLNPFFGYSAFNLTRPKESFYSIDNRLPIRHYFNGGIRVNITELCYVIPKTLVMLQRNATEQTYGVDAGYYMKKAEFYLLGGFMFRTKDAGMLSIGSRKDHYIFKIAYDINTSRLNKVSRSRGAVEISFTYSFKNLKTKPIRVCPRLQ